MKKKRKRKKPHNNRIYQPNNLKQRKKIQAYIKRRGKKNKSKIKKTKKIQWKKKVKRKNKMEKITHH